MEGGELTSLGHRWRERGPLGLLQIVSDISEAGLSGEHVLQLPHSKSSNAIFLKIPLALLISGLKHLSQSIVHRDHEGREAGSGPKLFSSWSNGQYVDLSCHHSSPCSSS
jgi:hypothetical protein